MLSFIFYPHFVAETEHYVSADSVFCSLTKQIGLYPG